MDIPTVSSAVNVIVVVVAVAVLGWVVWKRALLDVQSKAMTVQTAALDEYERRIKQLEDAVHAQGKQITHLEGVIKGKDDALRAVIDAIADTDRCLNAHSCANRSVPTI